MCRYFSFLGMLLFVISCRPTPFQVKPTPAEPPFKVEKTENMGQELDESQKAALIERYKKAQSPTVGIINGYYRLPNAQPFGAATVVRGYGYQTMVEGIKIESKEHPYAITPLNGDDALALNHSLNELLSMGVKIKELSMADAIALAEAERMAVDTKHAWTLNHHLPPTVDLLMSIYRTASEKGPVLVGRVIAKDGRLLAFKVLYNADHPGMLSSLVLLLFKDAINRL